MVVEWCDLLAARPLALRTRRPHARLEILLADIQRGAPLVQQFHRNPSRHKRTRPKRARPEEPQGSEESDPRAHCNNRQLLSVAPNPMLTDELTASRKLRGPGRPGPFFPPPRRPSEAARDAYRKISPAGVIRQAPDVRSVGSSDPARASGRRSTASSTGAPTRQGPATARPRLSASGRRIDAGTPRAALGHNSGQCRPARAR